MECPLTPTHTREGTLPLSPPVTPTTPKRHQSQNATPTDNERGSVVENFAEANGNVLDVIYDELFGHINDVQSIADDLSVDYQTFSPYVDTVILTGEALAIMPQVANNSQDSKDDVTPVRINFADGVAKLLLKTCADNRHVQSDTDIDTEAEDGSDSDMEEILEDDEVLGYSEDAKDLAKEFGIHDEYFVTYLDTRLLSAGAPYNMPHVVDNSAGWTEENAPERIAIADGVATLLHHYNTAALELFLNVSVTDVEFVRKEDSAYYFDLLVARQGKTVRVGFVDTCAGDDETGQVIWDCLVEAEILPNGIWRTKFASRCAITDGIFGPDENSRLAYHVEDLSRVGQLHNIARQMATSIIVREAWKRTPDAELRFSIM